MTRQTINLRRAFATNPARFLAVPTPRPTLVSRCPGEAHPSRVLLSPQPPTPAPNPLSEQLRRLGLRGMALGLARLDADAAAGLSSADLLSHLVAEELTARKERRIASRLRAARLRCRAPLAEVDYNAPRGFDDGLFHWLAIGQWIADRDNVIIDGPTGIGKTWLACALGEQACRDDRRVRYERVPDLLAELEAGRGSARGTRRLRTIESAELLILDDWGIEPFGDGQRRDMLDIIDRRSGRGSTLIASPVPVEDWARTIGDTLIAAAILDRILHKAHRLQLTGDSLRRATGP